MTGMESERRQPNLRETVAQAAGAPPRPVRVLLAITVRVAAEEAIFEPGVVQIGHEVPVSVARGDRQDAIDRIGRLARDAAERAIRIHEMEG
jgi:hypothetical protein